MRHTQTLDLSDSARAISLDTSDVSWTILRPQTPNSILNLETPVSTVSLVSIASRANFCLEPIRFIYQITVIHD